jgi:hypothetical protein
MRLAMRSAGGGDGSPVIPGGSCLTSVPLGVRRLKPGSRNLVTAMETMPLLAMKIVLVETTLILPSAFYLASGQGRRKRGLGAFEITIGPERPLVRETL